MQRLPLLFILAVIIFGAACTGPESAHKAADQTISADDTAPSSTAESAKLPKSPKKSFTKKVLYHVLVAEFARQRDQLPLAVSEYLDAATSSRDAAIAEQATHVALLAKDKEHALEAAALWMALDPDAMEAKEIYATLSIYVGRIEESIPILQGLLEHPDIPSDQRFTLVGELLARTKNKSAALAVMERMMKGYDDNPDAQFALAHFLVKIGQSQRATELLKRVLTMDGKNPVVWLYYAQFLRNQEKTAQALKTFSDALANGIEDKNIRIGFAQLLISEKRYEEAQAQFEQLIAANPEDADVRYILALFLMQIDRQEEARQHLLTLIDQRKFVFEAYFGLGQIAESRKDLPAAMALYRKVEDGQHYLDARIHIADLLAKQKKIPEARQCLHGTSAESAEDSIRLYRMEALILTEAGDFQEAMSIYDAALSDYPENTELLYDRAMLAGRMNRLSVLEQDLQRLLSQEPNHADALNALGYTLADQTDRHQEAITLIQRAMTLQPDSYYILDSMGWVLYRLGQRQKALDYLQRAFTLRQDAEVAAHLGEVLWVTGNRKAARDVWNKALKETPDDERLLKTMKRFDPSIGK